MSDLRERLEAEAYKAELPLIERAWPIIETELQKEQREISRWIRDCQSLIEELNAANQLLEQTIEVLEGAPEGPDFAYNPLWWLSWFDENCQPLLDKLQALKKEGTE